MFKKLCLTLLLFLTASTAFAQNNTPELTENFTDPLSGLTVNFPSDWSAVSVGNSNAGGLGLSNHEFVGTGQRAVQPGEMDIQVVPPKLLEDLLGGAAFEDAWNIMVQRLTGNPDEAVDVNQYASHGRYMTSQTEQYVITAGIVELEQGKYALLIATTHPNTVEEALPIYYAIGGSLSLTETVANTIFAKTQTFTSKDETFAFLYSADDKWTAYERDGVAVATNAGSITKFSASEGQYLIVVSAVPSDQADQSALIAALLSVQNFAIPLPPILINPDGSDNVSSESLEGLIGKQTGKDVAVATALVGQKDILPNISVGSDTQSSTQLVTDQDVVAIIKVFGPAGEEQSVSQMLDLVVHSLHVPIDFSDIKPATLKLSEIGEEGPLSVQYPSDWTSFFRGGLNVVGKPGGAKDDIRLIMSGRRLDKGETVEEALHSFVEAFNYDTFETATLTDGRTVYIGTLSNLTEAVFEVGYGNDLVITMSYLPNNPADFITGLPSALAILESIKIDV